MFPFLRVGVNYHISLGQGRPPKHCLRSIVLTLSAQFNDGSTICFVFYVGSLPFLIRILFETGRRSMLNDAFHPSFVSLGCIWVIIKVYARFLYFQSTCICTCTSSCIVCLIVTVTWGKKYNFDLIMEKFQLQISLFHIMIYWMFLRLFIINIHYDTRTEKKSMFCMWNQSINTLGQTQTTRVYTYLLKLTHHFLPVYLVNVALD